MGKWTLNLKINLRKMNPYLDYILKIIIIKFT